MLRSELRFSTLQTLLRMVYSFSERKAVFTSLFFLWNILTCWQGAGATFQLDAFDCGSLSDVQALKNEDCVTINGQNQKKNFALLQEKKVQRIEATACSLTYTLEGAMQFVYNYLINLF